MSKHIAMFSWHPILGSAAARREQRNQAGSGPLYAIIRLLTLWTAIGGWGAQGDTHAAEEPAVAPEPARFTMPAQPFTPAPCVITWSEAPAASAYYLYVGTSPGGKDLYQSGETKVTSVTLKQLPVNRILYLRLNTKVGNQWHFVDRTVVVVQPAKLQEPADGAVLPPGPTDFRWEPVEGAEAYRLYVGSAPGTDDLFRSKESADTSVRVSALPVNHSLHARLETKVAGKWHARDTRLLLGRPAELEVPDTQGLLDEKGNFRWQPVENAEAYFLYVGTTPGGRDLYQSGETQLTSVRAKNLPANTPLHARLNTKVGGRWIYEDRAVRFPAKAKLTKPAHRETVTPGRSYFMWEPVANAEAYRLRIGSERGLDDLFQSSEMTATSVTVNSLPENKTLHARLETKSVGNWLTSDSEFVIARPAEFLSPTAEGLLGEDREVKWQGIEGAQGYYLYIGTSPGAKDLYQSGEVNVTATTLNGLPTSRTLYARIHTKIAGRWHHRDQEFIVVSPAKLEQNPDRAYLASNPLVHWKPVREAETYRLSLGTTPDQFDVFSSGETQATEIHLSGIPINTPLHVRLETKIRGRWMAHDTKLVFAQPAELTYPEPYQSGLSPFETIRWNSPPNIALFKLDVGSQAGGSDIYSSGETTLTEQNLPRVRLDRVLHFRLWTRIAGHWYHTDRAIMPIAFLTSPSTGTKLKDGPVAFVWQKVEGASRYRLQVWSKDDASDIQDSGPIKETKFVRKLRANGNVIRTRLWTEINGHWYRNDAAYNLDLRILHPKPDLKSVDGALPMEWSPVWNARHYTLKIGLKRGSADLYLAENIPNANGLISIRHFVPNLPAGVDLYATVVAHRQNTTMEAETIFRVEGHGNPAAAREATALAVMREVHRMARREDGAAYPGTRLEHFADQNKRPTPVCTDYAGVLNTLLQRMNIGTSRILNVAFSDEKLDAHTLVALQLPGAAGEMILDPTFNLSAKRATDGGWATPDEISASTRAGKWQDIIYVGDHAPAQRYYLDYPLLFLNLLDSYTPHVSPLPYLTAVGQVAETPGYYTVRASGRSEIDLIIEDSPSSKQLSGPENFSPIFFAQKVKIPGGNIPGAELYRLNRYVFHPAGSGPVVVSPQH